MNALALLRKTIEKPRQDIARLFRFPSLSDRITINGRTGSGKTIAGAWLLSNAEFDKQPFIVVDFKGEEFFRKITRIKPLDLSDDIPDRPGLYHLTPLATDDEAVEAWLWKVWNKTHVGLFIDEGYLLPAKSAFKAILTTGRSRFIPTYTLSQRPVFLPRFTLSECDFYMCFHLNDRRDKKTVKEFTPDDLIWDEDAGRLPSYHSKWYDVGEDFSCTLDPVPAMDELLQVFDRRLTPQQKLL